MDAPLSPSFLDLVCIRADGFCIVVRKGYDRKYQRLTRPFQAYWCTHPFAYSCFKYVLRAFFHLSGLLRAKDTEIGQAPTHKRAHSLGKAPDTFSACNLSFPPFGWPVLALSQTTLCSPTILHCTCFALNSDTLLTLVHFDSNDQSWALLMIAFLLEVAVRVTLVNV
jgi:hypothetical protein